MLHRNLSTTASDSCRAHDTDKRNALYLATHKVEQKNCQLSRWCITASALPFRCPVCLSENVALTGHLVQHKKG
jgi:hypothetical protein